jgi:hypothetical protein
MVASFNDTESKRRSQFGPLLPVGDVKQDRFESLADIFMRECKALVEEVVSHWKQKGAL